MKMRSLGTTGLKVSPLCLGAMMFGGWGNPDHDDSIRIIHSAIDAGINFIDTADVYSQGESEEIVGKAIEGRRDELVIATKVHGQMGEDPNQQGNSRRWIMQEVRATACDASTPTTSTSTRSTGPTRRSTSTRRSARSPTSSAQGKVRYLGSSTFPGSADRRGAVGRPSERGQRAVRLRAAAVLDARARHRGRGAADVPEYGMGVIPWSPLAGGWLSGKWRLGADEPHEPPGRADPRSLRPLDAGEPAEARGRRRAGGAGRRRRASA